MNDLRKRPGAPRSAFREIYDPVYAGPGVWFTLHSQAIEMKPSEYISYVYKLANRFFCEDCLVHFRDYLRKEPPENYTNMMIEHEGVNRPLGLFAWSWNFHNNVNQRLGKQIMAWTTACDIYLQEKGCSKSCRNSK